MNNLTPLLVALKNDKQIDNNVVTFNLNHSDKDSTMTIGGYDDNEKSGDFTYHNVVNQAYWMINVDSIKLGDQVISSNLKGIVDTGTSLIVATSQTLGALANISISQDCSTDVSKLQDVTFVIDGTE